jgi:uncharacterized membrane protein YkoI
MRRRLFDRRTFLAYAAFLIAAAGPARGDDIDHNEALRLFQQGRILSLTEILTIVGKRVPGEVLEVELEKEGRRYVYELKILKPDGRVKEVEVNAATGRILKIEDDD